MDTSNKSPQEQYQEARRQQILEAAGRVFARDGFRAARMKDVASEAGVSNGTVYNYYPSKEALFQALLSALNETQQRRAHFAMGLEGGSIRKFMEEYTAHRLGVLWPHIETFRAVLPELFNNAELRKQYWEESVSPGFAVGKEYFEALVAQGELADFDVELGLRILAGSVVGLLVLRLLGDEVVEQRTGDLPKVLSALFFDGLAPKLAKKGTSDER